MSAFARPLTFVLLVWALGAPVSAQRAAATVLPAAMSVPFVASDAAVSGGALAVVVLGGADERRGPLTAARLSARRVAEARGRESLHAFVDAASRRASLLPSVVASLHAAIDHEARVVASRPRVDGSVMVRVSVPLDALRTITPSVSGLPWSS